PLDEQTHNIAIELCKECGDTSKAVGILRAMEGAGVRERTLRATCFWYL
ncbi:unnamed protein product, partial [Ectocarpus sp. 13 AM-2016]